MALMLVNYSQDAKAIWQKNKLLLNGPPIAYKNDTISIKTSAIISLSAISSISNQSR